jgi:hypothetical protein
MNDFRANKWQTRFSSENGTEIFNKTIPYISLIGIVGHPVFYLICTNLGYYDNLMFRIAASVLFLILPIIKRKNSAFFTIYSELVYTITLPFLFSFFLYTNDQNVYWKLSMLFAGAAYGMLVHNAVRSLMVIPLSCMFSFVCVNIFFHVTTVTYFYESMSTIISALGCAIVMIVVKNALKFMAFRTIELAAENKRIEEHRKQKELAQKNVQLQREIHLAQRIKLIAAMSEGILRETGDALTVIRDQASLINVNNKNEIRKEKIKTAIRIAENATATISQFDIFLKHNQVKPPITE